MSLKEPVQKSKFPETAKFIISDVIAVVLALYIFRFLCFKLVQEAFTRSIFTLNINKLIMSVMAFVMTLLVFWLIYSCRRKESALVKLVVLLTLVLLIGLTGPPLFDSGYPEDIYRYSGNGIYTYKPTLQYREKTKIEGKPLPIVYKFNSDGRRSCPYSQLDADKKIVQIGDSFAFGEFVDEKDTLCASLGDALKELNYGTVSIENFGMRSLALHSYTKLIEDYLIYNAADWITISYLSDNDLESFDTFDNLERLRTSALFRAASKVFGTHETAYLILRSLAMRKVQKSKNKYELFEDDVKKLERLSQHSRIILITYRENDDFVNYVQNNLKNISIVKFDMNLVKTNGVSEYEIPGDGHPNGKCNRRIAKSVADIILSADSQK